MAEHKYIQFGTISLVLMVPVFIMIIIMLFTIGLKDLIQSLVLILLAVTFLICILIFYKMTIQINDTHVIFRMGIGLITREYELSQIKSCRPVRNSPFYGVGIRKIPGGWLFNVTGMEAVEISFKNKKQIVRIGTNKSEEISAIISKLTDYRNHESFYDEKDFTGYYLTGVLLLLIILLPAILIIIGNREPAVSTSVESVTIKGMYGVTIQYTDLVQVDTTDMLPSVRSKKNGYAFGKTMKGNFTLTGGDQVKLFIKKGIPPYLYLKTGEMDVYINYNDPDSTRKLFRRIHTLRSGKNNFR